MAMPFDTVSMTSESKDGINNAFIHCKAKPQRSVGIEKDEHITLHLQR